MPPVIVSDYFYGDEPGKQNPSGSTSDRRDSDLLNAKGAFATVGGGCARPGIASHREMYLLRVLAYLQEYDIILSEP